MDWLAHYGLLAVLAGTLLEGESILVLAGFAAYQGHLDIRAVLFVAFVGGTLGDQFFFWFGRGSGPPLLRRSTKLAAAAQRISPVLHRHDALLIVAIRFMYGLRVAGPVAMGAMGVKPQRFAFFNVIGAAIWAPLIGGGGYLFGRVLQAWLGELEHYEGLIVGVILGAALIAFVIHHAWGPQVAARRKVAFACVGAALLALATPAHAGAALGAPGMRALHATIAPQLADNPFGQPLVLQSREAGRRVEGDVYAVLEHPFARVSTVLSDPGRWCDILILHLNTKYCRREGAAGAVHIELRVGKKQEQPVRSASLLDFAWLAPVARADYLSVGMQSGDGPYDTRDYLLMAEAVPLDASRTFLHLGYSFSFGGASSLAMQLYLGTIAHDKVGFSVVTPARAGEPAQYIGGMRGVTERNTMRYYLAIDAYLDSLALPPQQQLERRLASWFDATERYPRQLHEVEREAYLKMKRIEYERQSSAH